MPGRISARCFDVFETGPFRSLALTGKPFSYRVPRKFDRAPIAPADSIEKQRSGGLPDRAGRYSHPWIPDAPLRIDIATEGDGAAASWRASFRQEWRAGIKWPARKRNCQPE
ncbi:hypothetical protein GCM10011515_12120 [Tsuneonella deserti]|uniref:Uncharacterized protein n=1 Tax=Tsuneonella deserti TaxID=2035528 RepID=A0ABQ1S700_9SPHN|nr:hypothetical protein GCM10011515_12120 [Tsuneonella deserti]